MDGTEFIGQLLTLPGVQKNKRDFETLENLFDEAKCNLIKTFTDPSDGMIVDDINVNDWANEADEKKQTRSKYSAKP